MLQNTFCHVPTISVASEAALWNSGITSWVASEESTALPRFSPNKARNLRTCIAQSVDELGKGNISYFEKLLPTNQHWRLFREFRKSAAYVDIETTGLGDRGGDHITTIALYDGATVSHYVHGRNLQKFAEDVRAYDLLITYNGKCFDIPFIQRYFGITLRAAQIDLRYVLKSLGYRGGLKGCERRMGIDRKELRDVDGYFAVLLWDEFMHTGDPKALETLLAYNIADVTNLEILMVAAYNLKIQQTPFAKSHALPVPRSPAPLFSADIPTIDRIRSRSTFFH